MLTAFCAIFLLLMVVFAVYNIVMRYVFENPLVWGDLLTVLSNIGLVFLALALTVRDKDPIALDLIYSRLPVKAILDFSHFLSWHYYDHLRNRSSRYNGPEILGVCGTLPGKTGSLFSSLITCQNNMRSLSCPYRVFWSALQLLRP